MRYWPSHACLLLCHKRNRRMSTQHHMYAMPCCFASEHPLDARTVAKDGALSFATQPTNDRFVRYGSSQRTIVLLLPLPLCLSEAFNAHLTPCVGAPCRPGPECHIAPHARRSPRPSAATAQGARKCTTRLRQQASAQQQSASSTSLGPLVAVTRYPRPLPRALQRLPHWCKATAWEGNPTSYVRPWHAWHAHSWRQGKGR